MTSVDSSFAQNNQAQNNSKKAQPPQQTLFNKIQQQEQIHLPLTQRNVPLIDLEQPIEPTT